MPQIGRYSTLVKKKKRFALCNFIFTGNSAYFLQCIFMIFYLHLLTDRKIWLFVETFLWGKYFVFLYFVINANIPRIARFLGVQAVKDFVYLRYLTTLRLMLDMYFFRHYVT